MESYTLDHFNLSPNSDYSNQQVEVQHKNQEWYPLVKTANKVLYYEDENLKVRKMNLPSLVDVNFVNGIENTQPVSTVQEESKKDSVIVDDLYTNKDYSNSNIYVKHVDKGWRKLVRTANKVLYYDEDGVVYKMTLKKYDGYKVMEDLTPFDQTPDFFFDNYDYDMVG